MNKMTEIEATEKMKSLLRTAEALENEAVDIALEYNLDLYIEGKGRLLLEDSNGWASKGRGEWYTSTDSCS